MLKKNKNRDGYSQPVLNECKWRGLDTKRKKPRARLPVEIHVWVLRTNSWTANCVKEMTSEDEPHPRVQDTVSVCSPRLVILITYISFACGYRETVPTIGDQMKRRQYWCASGMVEPPPFFACKTSRPVLWESG